MSTKKKSSKTAKKTTLPPALFKTAGANAKMKVDDKKKKVFYLVDKVGSAKAKTLAAGGGADALGIPQKDVVVGAPSLKYDFYCMYDAVLSMKFVRLRSEEIGVNQEVVGVAVGNTVMSPKKGTSVPGNAIPLTLVELFEVTRKDSMILDGTTGSPANSLEKLLKGPGKKPTTAGWAAKSPVSPGKFNSVDKVVQEVSKQAGSVPKEAKRVVEHELSFKQLDGFYVPTYYVKVSKGEKFRIMRVNAVTGEVALKV